MVGEGGAIVYLLVEAPRPVHSTRKLALQLVDRYNIFTKLRPRPQDVYSSCATVQCGATAQGCFPESTCSQVPQGLSRSAALERLAAAAELGAQLFCTFHAKAWRVQAFATSEPCSRLTVSLPSGSLHKKLRRHARSWQIAQRAEGAVLWPQEEEPVSARLVRCKRDWGAHSTAQCLSCNNEHRLILLLRSVFLAFLTEVASRKR